MMTTLRSSFVALLSFTLGAAALVGCAASEGDTEGLADALDTSASVRSVTAIDLSKVQIVVPACRAVLLSTAPVSLPGGTPVCPSANPHAPQTRIAGNPESQLVFLADEARPNQPRCTTSPVTGKTTCSGFRDVLLERTCENTVTYECPCGVDTVVLDGRSVGFCRATAR